MIQEPKPPRFDDDGLIIDTQGRTEIYDAKYLVAAVLVFVAKSDGNISEMESQQMLALIEKYFEMPSAESLALLTRAITESAENPDMSGLLGDLSSILSTEEKEDIAVMLLKVVATDGRKDAEELEKLSVAIEIIDIPADVMHRAYDRYFAETGK